MSNLTLLMIHLYSEKSYDFVFENRIWKICIGFSLHCYVIHNMWIGNSYVFQRGGSCYRNIIIVVAIIIIIIIQMYLYKN